jgi:glycosyltransferase involved in cell wall biosynthesis
VILKKIFSVITVVYNDVHGIEETLLSVFEQSSRKDVEYIIVDGGSTDGTTEVINKYLDDIDIFVSEPDKGVYDAMNKAIKLSNGRYICFMNSSDSFSDSNVICRIKNVISSDEDIRAFYGNHYLKSHADGSLTPIKCDTPLKELWKKMLFSHQSFFVDTQWHKQNLFDVNNIAADHAIIYKSYQELNFRYIDLYLSKYKTGGISDNHLLKSTWCRYVNLLNYSRVNKLKLSSYYITLMCYLYIKKSFNKLRRILGQ